MSKKILAPLYILLALAFIFTACAKEHPLLLITKKEAAEIKNSLGKYPLLDQSFNAVKNHMDEALQQPIEVPPPGEAGGYEHEKHKQNYRDMQQAGLLYVITGNEAYAVFVRDMLLKYAEMYPKLGAHPLSHNQAPGKLFHQMLNETVWLVYTSQAYDCVYDWLTPQDRRTIEANIFRPMVQWFTERNGKEFDRIHNHGTWSVASVGMLGYVLDDKNLVDMALYGTNKDGKGGFLKQLDLLFSPDGYYMEGPYYIRYALRPFFLFAEAIERNQPQMKIYDYRDQILKKAIYSALETTFPNGVFPPINDASRTMNVSAVGVVIANDLAYYRYGANPNLLGIAKIQDNVILNEAGLAVAKDFASHKTVPDADWGSVEFTDGPKGQSGGLGILRMGVADHQSMLLMKYGVHGEGHGHFDELQFIFYDQNREVIPDYGYARWINVEPKYGGRYLPENDSYAKQTIAHNTVTVDQKSQNEADRKAADEMSGERHFFDAGNPDIKVMSANANDYYPGVGMQRTMFLLNDKRLEYPVVVDVFRLVSSETHSYDYPMHYLGQFVTTNVKYQPNQKLLKPLGDDFGYQHIWDEAEAQAAVTFKFTWLDGNRYYSLVSAVKPDTRVFWGRTGANDPNFNLRSEPMVILRSSGQNCIFVSVVEPHGYFNEAAEMSRDARGVIQNITVIGDDQEGTVIQVTGKNNLEWLIMISNGPASETGQHSVTFSGKTYNWTGNYKVELNTK